MRYVALLCVLWGSLTSCDSRYRSAVDTSDTVQQRAPLYVLAGADPLKASGHRFAPYATLNAALAAAADGDVIVVGSGIYKESLTLSKDVEIRGNGITQTIIAPPTGQAGLTIVAATVTIGSLTIRGGAPGAAVSEHGSLTLTSVALLESRLAGLHLDNATAVLSGVTIKRVSLVSGDPLSGNGILLRNGSKLTMTSGRISEAEMNGVYSRNSEELFDGTAIAKNHNAGLSLQLGKSTVLRNVEISDNARMGIFIAERTLVLEDSRISNNGEYGMLTSPGAVLIIERNWLERHKGEGITIVGGSATVRDNVISRNGDGGLTLQGVETTSLVEKNTVIDNVRHGIHLSYSRNVTVRENVIQRTLVSKDPAFGDVLGDGIVLLESLATIEGNRVEDSQGAGIYGQYSGATVLNNELHRNAEAGIFLTDNFDRRWHVTGNLLTSNVGGGLVVRRSEIVADKNDIRGSLYSERYQVGDGIVLLEIIPYAKLTENVVDGSAGSGIGVYLTTSATISGNSLSNNHLYGIYASCNSSLQLSIGSNSYTDNAYGDQYPCD